ncbi:unnamed protein product [Ectocarpus sp. 13 AM-2016]
MRSELCSAKLAFLAVILCFVFPPCFVLFYCVFVPPVCAIPPLRVLSGRVRVRPINCRFFFGHFCGQFSFSLEVVFLQDYLPESRCRSGGRFLVMMLAFVNFWSKNACVCRLYLLFSATKKERVWSKNFLSCPPPSPAESVR